MRYNLWTILRKTYIMNRQKLKIKTDTYTDLNDLKVPDIDNRLDSPSVKVTEFALSCDDNADDNSQVEKYRYIEVDFTLEKERKALGSVNKKETMKFSRLILMRNPN